MDTVEDFEDLLDLPSDGLIEIKSGIDHPRHQEDVRVLRMVRERRERERET